jgi:hypothetical protein
LQVRYGERVREGRLHRRREARGVEDLAFESEDAVAGGVVGGFGEVVGLWVVFGRASGRVGEGGLGKQVRVDVCDAAEGAGRGGDFGYEVD